MPIRVTCGGCAKSFAVKDRFAGLNGICPYCGGGIAVPAQPLAAAVGAAAGASGIASAIEDASGSSSGSGSGATEPSSAVSLAMASEIPRKACPKCTRQNLAAASACFFCGAPFSDAFDPYHKWLGIPRHQQPPHHYRLLGVALFETDLDVISEAADQRMAHVRTHQNGPHATQSQKLLNELSAAKVQLLNRDKKAIYDNQLRQRMGSAAPQQAIPLGTTPMGAPSAVPMGVTPVPAMMAPGGMNTGAMPGMAPAAVNPLDQMLPPTVWSGPTPGAPVAPYGGMPGQPGMGQPGYYPQQSYGPGPGMAGPMAMGGQMVGQMGPIPLTSPRAEAPVSAAESNVALKARRRASGGGGAGVVHAMIAIGVTLAIMGLVAWMMTQ